MEFTTPTPIQVKAIPLVLERRDIIGLAQTGTGKTAAFGLPIIEHLLTENQRPEPKAVRTLILAPTRELVNQIAGNLRSFIKDTKLRIALVVGGASIHKQSQLLARGTDILVATPGRLLDLCKRNDVNLTAVRYLVLDEADQMLDLGFIHDLRRISKMVPKRRQTLLFSATMPRQIEELAQEYLTDPLRVEASTPGKTADKIEQFVHHVTGKDQKTQLLRQSLTDNPDGRAMVFLKTKHSAEKLSKHLENIGFAAASIHGNKSQSQRERALKAFRDGEMRVLVATDVAARGIDIPGVTHVYNYDLPTVAEAYVHRIGRTARAGKEGIAIAFCAPDEIKMLRDIEKLTKMTLTVASGEPPADVRGSANQPSRGAARPARKPHRKGQGQGRPQQGGEGAEARGEQNARPARRPHAETQGAAERKRDNGGNNGHHQAGRPSGDRNRSDRPGQKRGNRGGKPGGYTRAAQG